MENARRAWVDAWPHFIPPLHQSPHQSNGQHPVAVGGTIRWAAQILYDI